MPKATTARPAPEVLLDIEAAAEVLACSPRTIKALHSSGSLPVVKVGRLVRFKPSDVAAYIESRRTPAA